VERLVFASSREVYGEQRELPVGEERAPSAKNVYGATKIAGEALLNAFGAALPVVALRFANVIGTGDTGRVVPRWIGAAREGRALTLFGGEQVLDLVPVDFAVEALLRSVCRPLPVGPINVGTGVGTTLRELAAAIVEATGSHSRVCQEPAREAEVTKFIADTARLRRELRLAPPVDALACLPAIVHSVRA
jgi:UDP-glucose 4-epimerase